MTSSLSKFYRTFKLYMKLPSGTKFYSNEDVEFTETGEIGVRPMTGQDELIMKNPDALLNGEAMISLINSCVPGVKNPRKLLANDIDALVTAIRAVTYADALETTTECPKCKHSNTFKLNLQYSLDNMTYLSDFDTAIHMESGETLYIKPHSFPDMLRAMQVQFENSKFAKALEDQAISGEQRTQMISAIFSELNKINIEMMVQSIIRIVCESEGVDVSDPTEIHEYVMNIDKTKANKIHDAIKAINEVGIKKTYDNICEKCNHKWTAQIDFNPVTFF